MAQARVAVVVSHPIQHFCPQYANWAALPDVDLKVVFATDRGLVPYMDERFGRIVKWEGISLNFAHHFLSRVAEKPSTSATVSGLLEAQLSAFAPRALVVYGYAQALQQRALRWARSSGVQVLMISDSELRSTRGVLKRALKALVLPRVFDVVSAFLTVGDANEAYYRRYGAADARFIRCFFPIDVSQYDAVMAKRDEHRTRVRSELGIQDHHLLVFNVGKLVPWKRQGDLVRFSNALAGERGDVTVLLAGTGPDEAALRRLARTEGVGGTVFAGFIPPETLAAYYCAADIYVHCSEHEPHSLAISEAIYSGLPVVLSDRCGSYGPTDDVQPGLNGTVYRCGDVGHLSQQVLQLVRNPELRARMGEASRHLGRAHQELAHGAALRQALTLLELNN